MKDEQGDRCPYYGHLSPYLLGELFRTTPYILVRLSLTEETVPEQEADGSMEQEGAGGSWREQAGREQGARRARSRMDQ